MSPRIVQDVVPTPRKSIRDIPLPPSRGRQREKLEVDESVREVQEEFHSHRPSGNRSKKYLVIIGILVVLAALFFGADAFAHATVSVVLSSQSDPVESSFVTRTLAAASSTNGITDSPIMIAKTGSATVTASGSQDVETKAVGTIIIFNDYSTAAQKLVANTRFETSSGLIYRIAQSVSVPGKTTKGSVTTPGSVTAAVTADQVGEKYDIGLSDFTVPGFAGEPEYDGIFARSQTSMTGGFSGMQPIVATSTRSAALATIDANLASEVTAAALSSVPSGYILYPNAYRIDYVSLPDTDGSGNNVTLNEEATLTGFALSENDIDTALAASAVKSYAGEPITVANLGALTFSTSAVPTATSTPLSFTIAGTADFVYAIDADTFAAQLAGRPKGDFTGILQGYPHIDKASVSFFPFWSGHFPANAADISIATTSSI